MDCRTQVTFIFQLLIIIRSSFPVRRNTSILNARESYNTTYDQRQRQDPLCDANFMIKTAVCDAVFSNLSIQVEYGIYLNKNAIFYSWISCENHNVIVHPNEETKIQRMFPCYGRHHPMLSGWGIDDHFKFIYISGGPYENSLFLYRRELTPDDELYYLQEIIDRIDFDRLQSITITYQETQTEQQLLQFMTIINNSRIIEVNYIRNIIKGQYKYPATFSICNLSKQQKLTICRKVLEQIQQVENFPFQLIEHLFGIMSMQCIYTNILFLHYEVNEEVQRKTFTCYGYFKGLEHNLTRLKVSDGYYQNTILVFMSLVDYPSDYKLRASIHNISITQIEPTFIPPPPPSISSSSSST